MVEMVQEGVCLVGRETANDIENRGGEFVLDVLDGLHVRPVTAAAAEGSVGSASL